MGTVTERRSYRRLHTTDRSTGYQLDRKAGRDALLAGCSQTLYKASPGIGVQSEGIPSRLSAWQYDGRGGTGIATVHIPILQYSGDVGYHQAPMRHVCSGSRDGDQGL